MVGEIGYSLFDLPKIFFFQMFSVPVELLHGSVRMFKGSLLSKGGHLTRRFAEDVPILLLLCCPTLKATTPKKLNDTTPII